MKKLYYLLILIQLLGCTITKEDKVSEPDTITKTIKESETKEENTAIQKNETTIEEYYVTAKSGLNYRKEPNGKVLGKLHYGKKLLIIKHTNVFETIKDDNTSLKGEWLLAKHNNDSVYVFDAYLTKEIKKINTNKLSNYLFIVDQINSNQFFTAQKIYGIHKQQIPKITDFKVAKKMLKGVVKFGSELCGEEGVADINYRNGTKLKYQDIYAFVAYYPSEDILLCEGGHSIDVSFNLKNGKETEETGNLNIIQSSPDNNFRINGYFGGQECTSYFIQKKVNNEYIRIIDLDENFENQTDKYICTIKESFWSTDNKTLFLMKTDGYGEEQTRDYFKIELFQKTN